MPKKKECTKTPGTPPKCTKCIGDHPANFTWCPKYLQQLKFSRRSTLHGPSPPPIATPTVAPALRRPRFPTQKTPSHTSNPTRTWADVAAKPPPSQNHPPLGAIFDNIKSILSIFDTHKLCTHLRSLAFHLQEKSDPIFKLVMIAETVFSCFPLLHNTKLTPIVMERKFCL